MASPRKKSSSLIFAPCMKMQSAIARMYCSCSLRICVGSTDNTLGGTRDLPSSYVYLTTTSAFRISSPPAIWATVRFDSFKNVTKSCCCIVCATTRGSIDCFFWALSCGTSDYDDFDCLFFFSVVLIIVTLGFGGTVCACCCWLIAMATWCWTSSSSLWSYEMSRSSSLRKCSRSSFFLLCRLLYDSI